MIEALSIDPVIARTLRVALAFLFANAAWHKWRDRAAFSATLSEYRMLPARSIAPVSIALASAETAIAAALPWPGLVVAACLGATGLLALYSVAIATNLVRGRRWIDCGCLGPNARQPLSERLVVRNLLLMTATVVAALPEGTRALVWLDWLSIAGAACCVGLIWTAIELLSAARQVQIYTRSPA